MNRVWVLALGAMGCFNVDFTIHNSVHCSHGGARDL